MALVLNSGEFKHDCFLKGKNLFYTDFMDDIWVLHMLLLNHFELSAQQELINKVA